MAMGDNEARLRDFYLSTGYFDEPYAKIVNPLLGTINPEKGVPLYIQGNTDCYTSTTATTILALYHCRLLNSDLLLQLQERLIWMRDITSNSSQRPKEDKDVAAWGVPGPASVWSTLLALWTLLETRYNGDQLNNLTESITWLLDQQNKSDKGWGYDSSTPSRLHFTCVAVHVLKLALKQGILEDVNKTRAEVGMDSALSSIRNSVVNDSEGAHWCSRVGEPASPTATLYALWALGNSGKRENSDLVRGGLKFMRNRLAGKSTWDFETIIIEPTGTTRYGVGITITSFTPAFVIILLELGVDPLDELCTKPLRWLKTHYIEGGWGIEEPYGSKALTFATALGLWAINKWHRYLIKQTLKPQVQERFSVVTALRKRIKALLAINILTLLWILWFIGFLSSMFANLSEFLINYSAEIELLDAVLGIIGIALLGILGYFRDKLTKSWIGRGLKRIRLKITKYIFVE